ncbi:hypothetical protein [Ktedonobacter sp. SOSP1-52]|uniref:hypothetical protein n=1 Tax=Ktedonobacter sp. SOSP1-52 TaxID=2778366 RepID=UPI001916AE1A|nr:hypothetical protein [Ktedonobacter sp. SOSP1-52]
MAIEHFLKEFFTMPGRGTIVGGYLWGKYLLIHTQEELFAHLGHGHQGGNIFPYYA